MEFLVAIDAVLVAKWCIGAAAVAWVSWFFYIAWKAGPTKPEFKRRHGRPKK